MDRAEVKRLYVEEELSLRGVARRLGVSVNQVQAALDAMGVQRRPATREKVEWTPEVIAEAVRLYVDEGYSLHRIRHRLRTSTAVLKEQLEAAGVQIRKRWPAKEGS